MFTFTDNEILTNEKCFDNLYDLYRYHYFTNKLVLVLENKIMYELPLKMISVKWAVALAERSLHMFEEKRPLDNRPRLAIEAAKQWINDPTIDTTVASNDSSNSNDATLYNDDVAASYACYAASCAAATAAVDNAAAAVSAAVTNVNVNTAYLYNSNVDNFSISEQQNWSRNKLKEIVEEYLNNYKHLLKNTIKHLIIPELSDIIIKYIF